MCKYIIYLPFDIYIVTELCNVSWGLHQVIMSGHRCCATNIEQISRLTKKLTVWIIK